MSHEYDMRCVYERVHTDPDFSAALLNEAINLFFNGETDVARLLLRDLVNATLGFDQLAIEIDKTSRSLQRMLSAKGSPTMDNLAKIINVLRDRLGLSLHIEIRPQ